MACFWKNERNAVEVCLREVGNYVYIGYEDPDPESSLVEVARDLSGYVKTPVSNTIANANGSLYSKRRKIYQPRYNTTPNPDTVTVWRDDGEVDFTAITGVPTGLSVWSQGINYTGGKLRGVNWDAGSNASFYESDDGETWSLLPGSVTIPNATAGQPSSYTVLGSRIITNRLTGSGVPQFYYSDNGGATWSAGTGAVGNGSEPVHPFVHSGSSVIAVGNGDIYRTTDGAAWTHYTGLYMWFFDGPPNMAANGAGKVVAYGQDYGTAAYAFAYSSNHGASWAVRTVVAIGMPANSFAHGVFWDAAGNQFVALMRRGDLSQYAPGSHQIYTSPTGQNWTAGIVIPVVEAPPTQVID